MLRRAATYLALTTAGLAQPLLQLYGDNNAVFTAAHVNGPPVVYFALVVLLSPVLLLLTFDLLVSRTAGSLQRVLRCVLVSVAALPLCLLPFRSADIPWVVAGLSSVCAAAAVAFVHDRSGTVRSWLVWLSPYSLVVLAAFLLSAQGVIVTASVEVVEVSATTTSVPRGATAPEDVSVVWLQLDEAPLWPLLRTDGTVNAARFPGFAALAGSSTWYRNALGLSQTTVDAVPAMLTGRRPVTGRAPTYWNHRQNLFSLMFGRRAMDVHEIATALCPREACSRVSVSGGDDIATAGTEPGTTTIKEPSGTTPAEETADWVQFARDTAVVLGHKLLPRGLRAGLAPIDEGWGGFGNAGSPDAGAVDSPSSDVTNEVSDPPVTTTLVGTRETLVETKRNTVTNWQRGGAPSQVPVVTEMTTRAARSAVPTLHFAHVLLPHRPWQLTPDVRTTRAITTDKRSAEVVDRVRDEYQAFLAQYVATDSLVLDLVTRLRRSANWDRTMVIVTADHGIAFEPGESKRKDINPANAHTLEQIYRVPLFVKWPDQKTGDTSDCPVQGFDVLPMVMNATGLDPGWTIDGVDPSSSCPSRPRRTVWWDKGSTSITTGFSAAVDEAVRLGRWVDPDGSVDDIARTVGYSGWFDADLPVSAPRDGSITGWSTNQSDEFRRVGDTRLSATPFQFDGRISVREAVDDGAVGLVVVAGKVIAVVPEIAGAPPGSHHFRSVIVPSALVGGPMTPELWVGRGDPASPRLTRVGPPAGG